MPIVKLSRGQLSCLVWSSWCLCRMSHITQVRDKYRKFTCWVGVFIRWLGLYLTLTYVTTPHCNTLHHTLIHCNALQNTATHRWVRVYSMTRSIFDIAFWVRKEWFGADIMAYLICDTTHCMCAKKGWSLMSKSGTRRSKVDVLSSWILNDSFYIWHCILGAERRARRRYPNCKRGAREFG